MESRFHLEILEILDTLNKEMTCIPKFEPEWTLPLFCLDGVIGYQSSLPPLDTWWSMTNLRCPLFSIFNKSTWSTCSLWWRTLCHWQRGYRESRHWCPHGRRRQVLEIQASDNSEADRIPAHTLTCLHMQIHSLTHNSWLTSYSA